MPSRRDFFKAATVGGSRRHHLWVRPQARLRATQRVKDCTRCRNALDLSLLRGRMRRPHLHDRRPGEERHAAGDPRRRRS